MSTRLHAADNGEVGATMIEALVVLAILAAMAAVVWPMQARLASERVLPSAVGEVIFELRSGRAEALRSGRETAVVFDLEARSIGQSGRSARTIPSDVAISVTTPRSEQREGALTRIRFLPDGRSSGADIQLEHRGRRTRIVVDWLNGGVRVAGP
jgi:general secretion pathway protein H